MNKFFTYKNFTFIFSLIFLKFFLIYLVIYFNFGQGIFLKNGDAETYHLYATGYLYDRVATNFWFWFLKELNSLGIYNREIIIYCILFINTIILPIVYTKIVFEYNFIKNHLYYFLSIFLLFFFPSILYHSFDIFRDVVMLFVFFISLYLVKKNNCQLNINLIPVLFFGLWLFWFRDYLGFSFLLAYFASMYVKIYKSLFYTKLFVYLVLLFIFNYLGLFDPLIEYRNWFVENDANTNLKIDFSNKSMFFLNFLHSSFIQLFGFYFINVSSFILFFLESVPFIICLIYIIKNRSIANEFLNFCFIFFIFYTSIWLISNDNFGTAIRLRWFSYFPIYISALILYQIKNGSKK
ncbi:hypothetical protein [Acinetobacter sp. YH12117]|uniref:hypothetical protein n=1 Tax=Acinetobacter sp. YH12117 TaxID=2601104 RepID=UPI0015D43E87|nr:hypothetical protein [Acinetobacter sp. YH12117]